MIFSGAEGFENKIFTRLGEYGSKAIAAHFAMLSKTLMLLRSNLKMHKNGRLTSEMFPADQQGKVVEYIFLRDFFLTLN